MHACEGRLQLRLTMMQKNDCIRNDPRLNLELSRSLFLRKRRRPRTSRRGGICAARCTMGSSTRTLSVLFVSCLLSCGRNNNQMSYSVSAHGIQRAVKVPRRQIDYDNHPFKRDVTAQNTTTRNLEFDLNRGLNEAQPGVEIRSNVVPPLSILLQNSSVADKDFDLEYQYMQYFQNMTEYNTSTIGPFYLSKTYEMPVSSDLTDLDKSSGNDSIGGHLEHRHNYKPLRLVAFMQQKYTRYLTPHQLKVLTDVILEPALTAWSDSLHTVPVREGTRLTLDPSQLEDGQYCGAAIEDGESPIERGDRVLVPSKHIEEGVKDADTVIYISLGFSESWLELQLLETEKPFYMQESEAEVQEEVADPFAVEESEAIEGDWVRHRFYKARVPSIPSSSSLQTFEVTDSLIEPKEDGTWENNANSTKAKDSAMSIGATEDAYGEADPVVVVQDEQELKNLDNVSNQTSSQSLSIKNETMSLTNTTAETLSALPPPPACAHPSNILASASFCNTDQYDRPVAGVLHICISDPAFFHEHSVATKTVLHELAHILGFNPISLAHFRFPDGSPMTERDDEGNVPMVDTICTGIETNQSGNDANNQEIPIIQQPLPSEHVLRFSMKRTGVRVAEIVTETVAMVARNQFGCESLEGAELESFIAPAFLAENSDLPPPFCIGSHWSRRLFQTDLMNPIVDYISTPVGWRFNETTFRNDTNLLHYKWRFSPLTLAYFVDSGWYRVNPARTSHVHGWGRGAGCDFVEQPCVDPTTGDISAKNEAFFCNDPLLELEVHGCTEDFSRKAVCELVDFNQAGAFQADEVSLPEQFQYFNNSSGDFLTSVEMGWSGKRFTSLPAHSWGGKESDMEFCPYFRGFSNGVCNTVEKDQILNDRYTEEISVNSRCVVSTVSRKTTGLCMPIACVISDSSLRIKVDGVWKKCRFAGERHYMWWNEMDFVICPDPVRTCPTFYCPRNCLGTANGICDFTTGLCMCSVSHSKSLAEEHWETFHNASNSTIVPCEIPPDFQLINSAFDASRDSTGWARMDLSLSEYYVQDSTVLRNESKRLSAMILRFFKTSNPVIIATFCILIGIFIFVFGWLTSFVLARIVRGSDGQVTILELIRRRRLQGNHSNASNLDEKADEKTIASAAMLIRLRMDSIKKYGKKVSPHDPPAID